MMKRLRILSLVGLLVASLLVGSLVSLLPSTPVAAANASNFDPGRIIDDDVFYKSSAMSSAQIQSFLNARVPDCDTNGTGAAVEWGRPDISRATLAYYKRTGTNGYTQDTGFHAPPYTCLRDYRQNTPQMEGASGLCGALSAKTSQTSAQIIKSIATACGINPQVLLVLLQKEQSLVTDIWPLQRQFRSATGFDCPDTAPCDPAYSGFFYQVYYAARQFKVYQKFPNDYNYLAGRTNRIYWHPDLSRCGSSDVYIDNQATAALYIYTPYRPNQAALNNLYGTGDSCSSYGNRNFWRLFTDWFGSTQVSFTNFETPRVMRLVSDTQKVNLHTNESSGPVFPTGAHTYFVDKIFIYGKWYARTETDHNNNNFTGIPIEDIGNIPVEDIAPQWVSVNDSTEKVDPFRRNTVGTADGQSAAKILSRVTVSGVEYFRTETDHLANKDRFIRASDTTSFAFYSFANPRVLASSKSANKIDVQTGTTVSTVPPETLLTFSHKLTVKGVQYVRASEDSGTNHVYAYSDFAEIADDAERYFVELETPRLMELGFDTNKVLVISPEQILEPALTAGRQARFVDKVLIDGNWYARTESDKELGRPYAIPASDLIDIPVVDITPQWMSVNMSTQKIDPIRGIAFENIDGMTAANFVDKVVVNGQEYYRTAYEGGLDRPRFIPASALESFRLFDFARPREMVTIAITQRVNIQTGAVQSSIPANTTIFFNRKITIGGILYAQAQSDNGTLFAVRASALKEK